MPSKAADKKGGKPLPPLPQEPLGLLLAGADEAGRGPLAGPVVAAAVILDPSRPIAGLADSKILSEKARDRLEPEIKERALAWAVAACDVEEIEELNILGASMEAMRRAIAALSPAAQHAWIDGNRTPKGLLVPATAIVKGDARVACIAAASILAKTARDKIMRELAVQWPGYGFEVHMGYPTPSHLAALERLGACPRHRPSFGPVRRIIEASKAPE
jgi:ribonuclease HII